MEIFSEHFKKDNFLSKIDVRVRLLVVLSLLVMVLGCTKIFFPILIAMGCFLLCLKMKIPSRVLLLRMAQPLFLATVIFLLKFFFTGDDALFSVNLFGLKIIGYKDGFIEGLKIASRILGGVSLVVAFGFSTPFTEIMAGLSWLRVPKQFIEILMFAYRYIFVFLEDGLTIYNAQKNRLGYISVRKGLNSFGILTGSLVLRSFEQSQKTSEAMIQRGYTGNIPVLKNRPLKSGEIACAIACVIFAGVIWMI